MTSSRKSGAPPTVLSVEQMEAAEAFVRAFGRAREDGEVLLRFPLEVPTSVSGSDLRGVASALARRFAEMPYHDSYGPCR